ncbi:MAG: DUF423 domain-containing protein [Alphaproteobacteria bacterium]|nr:DUF423 domain-containing protein [Alphaproteobacteria bacterium]
MRILNIAAALSGAFALVMLTMAAHVLDLTPPDHDRVQLGAFVQLVAAAAALAIANRSGKLNLIVGAMIVGGASVFAAVLYTLATTHMTQVAMLAPIGGLTLIGGWILLAFAKPGT